MAPREGSPWTRHERDLAGAWEAILDLRDEVDRLGDHAMITAAVRKGMDAERHRVLTGVRGLVVMGCSFVVAMASLATAWHAWMGH